MKNSLLIALMLIGGAVIMYAAIKGQDPREIVKTALKVK